MLDDGTNGTVSPSNGWHRTGTNLQLTVTADTNYVFDCWAGDVPEEGRTAESVTLTMAGARTIQPQFLPDTDNDGLPDSWEVDNFGDTLTSDGSGDQDSDGMIDRDERVAGTHPTNFASALRFSNLATSDTEGVIRWQGVSGRVYQVECTTNLIYCAPSVLTSLTAVAADNVYTSPVQDSAGSYYRIKVRR